MLTLLMVFFFSPKLLLLGAVRHLDTRQASLTQYSNFNAQSRTHRTEALKDINLRCCKFLISGPFLRATKF